MNQPHIYKRYETERRTRTECSEGTLIQIYFGHVTGFVLAPRVHGEESVPGDHHDPSESVRGNLGPEGRSWRLRKVKLWMGKMNANGTGAQTSIPVVQIYIAAKLPLIPWSNLMDDEFRLTHKHTASLGSHEGKRLSLEVCT